MPIPSTGEMLVKAEAKAIILEHALMEMASVVAARQPQSFPEIVRNVIERLDPKSVRHVRLPEADFTNSVDEKDIQQKAFGLAVEVVKVALDRASHRSRPR